MDLATLCKSQLSRYFQPWARDPGFASEDATDGAEFRSSAARYWNFRGSVARLLQTHSAEAGIDFMYVTLPALLRAAADSDGISVAADQIAASAQLVSQFLRGYRTAYQPLSLHDIAFKTLEKQLFTSIPHTKPSLELGIGNGYVSDFIFGGSQLTVGSDPTLSVLNAKRYRRHEQYVAIDATCIPFQQDTFRSVYMVHSIDHVRSREDVLKEMARVLQPGGVAVFSDLSDHAPRLMPMSEIYSVLGLSQLSADEKSFYLDYAGESREFYSPERYREVLGRLGFEDVQIKYFLSPALARMVWLWFSLQLAIGRFEYHLELLRSRRHSRARQYFFDFVLHSLPPLIAADEELCSRDGGGFNYFILARKGGSPFEAGEVDVQKRYICPRCKQGIENLSASWVCSRCDLRFPIVESVPLLVPSYAEAYSGMRRPLPKGVAKTVRLVLGEAKRHPGLTLFLKKVRSAIHARGR